MGCDIHMWFESRAHEAAPWLLVRPEFHCGRCEGRGTRRGGDLCYWCKGGGRVTKFDDRNYALFSVLANVRNPDPPGTRNPWRERFIPDWDQWNVEGDPITPISEPRGFPDDLSEDLRAWLTRCRADEDDDAEREEVPPGQQLAYPGDHSASWLLLSEVLAYFECPRLHIERGMVPFDQWSDTWAERFYSRSDEELSYSRGVTGGNTLIVSMDDARRIKAGEMQKPANRSLYVRAEWAVDVRQQIGPTFLDHLVPALLRLGNPNNVRLVFNFDS